MTPRHLYLTDQDARKIEAVLELRTKQLNRAYTAVFALATATLTLLAILIAVVA